MRIERRPSRIGWALATVAPWALGAGLLVSFTASAGIDQQSGISAAARDPALAHLEPGPLVPPSPAQATAALPRLGLAGIVQEARLRFDLPSEALQIPDDRPPRADLKATAPAYPAIDRSRKGDPLVAMRPSLSRRAADLAAGAGSTASRLMFRKDERTLPTTVLMSGSVQPDLESENTFAPVPADERTTTLLTTAARSPAAAASGSTGAGRSAGTTPRSDGATPSVPRAVSLASATPAPVDATPLEIAAVPVSPLAGAKTDRGGKSVTTAQKPDPDRPNYAGLVSPDSRAREERCLAEAVYFEARSESAAGQAAVAQVVLNRVKSGLYPTSICGVVYQNRHRYMACQFSFACEGKSLRITDNESWRSATRVASEVLEGRTYLAEVGSSTHYHADYVRPRWAKRLKKMDVIGRHIFYKLKPGQT